jgi:hypothetical protein
VVIERGPRPAGPVPLSMLFDQVQRRLQPNSGAPALGDGFLYSGNPHESVPRALFLDRRLTPLERNAWQVFRLQLNDDGITAFPTYEQLQPYLASMPCSPKASSETVARALTLLRLTRWLSLVRRRRDTKTGRIQGNLYVLHDEPLTPFEAIQLDADYLSLVSSALTHASKAIQRVGYHALKEMADDPLLSGRVLPTRLQVLSKRLVSQGWAEPEAGNVQVDAATTGTAHNDPQAVAAPKSEEGSNHSLRNPLSPTSDSEGGPTAAVDDSLRNPNQGRTVRSTFNKDVRTVRRASNELRLPKRFSALKSEQQAGALSALQQVEESLRQAVLDEWESRCRASTVRNPAGYLFGIVQKALRGEFHASVGHARQRTSDGSPSTSAPATSAPSQPSQVTREVALEHIARLRSLLRIP